MPGGRRLLAAAAAGLGVQGAAGATLAPWLAKFVVRGLEGGESGNFTVRVNPRWAPVGARRFRRLVDERFYSGARFFRVVRGFVAQFGVHGDPAVSARWRRRPIADDLPKMTNRAGRVSFAAAGPDTRSTQLFINLGSNRDLDKLDGLVPFAEVVEGMGTVLRLYGGYGEAPPRGRGPNQTRIQLEGNSYLVREFPLLSYVEAVLVGGPGAGAAGLAGREEERLAEARMLPVRVMLPVLLVIMAACSTVLLKVYWRMRDSMFDGEAEHCQGRRKRGFEPLPRVLGSLREEEGPAE
ncbi:unnamed protein product [Prorocentrum cordatum]|uniref:Peptidyl-prolyl cis-trans isomerase n=1 Tax=Prorocentrum cordatum TaxID=2364126 RepID=A0ABN9XY86_9DINO|nr:unnamed protein product [Polarella glacialis]